MRHLFATFLGGLVLHTLGTIGVGFALLGLFMLITHMFRRSLQGQRVDSQSALTLGLLVNGETFVRDFAMRGLPAGYLAVEYTVILLGLVSLPALFARQRRAVLSAPVLILLCICLWDAIGLFYSEDLWMGRVTVGLHFAGLACLLLGAASFTSAEGRLGLLNGIILGAFLSLGVMLRQTVKASYGTELDSEFRFGHALVSAVQVSIVLTTGMLACLLKLVYGYGKPLHALVAMAFLAPFCIATFSRGPLLAFFAAALCLSLYRRGSHGWWKLPVAGLLLSGALFVVMWALPSNFDNRYRELQGRDERSRIWSVVVEMWKKSPIIGYGPGSWWVVYPRFTRYAERAPSTVSDAHNFLFQAASDGGAIGVILFVAFLLGLMHRVVMARSAICLALFFFVVINASLANFKLAVLLLLLGAGFGDCLTPSRQSKQELSIGRNRARLGRITTRGRRLVAHRLMTPRRISASILARACHA